ncbi:NUDIX hydrolase [Streptomyces qinglanensis]|uniref:8-oxo-dGTP diphosphatase n=1 Tax=Streptomyces qinglanensis TaxID=943816 RepID=A0A1H9RYE0_9ACTN|nr:NUDIX domain-containing protein [Streptomyces qinglanensis]SER77816.1 8-oxo-dGTP diphosphatase [Streptomyces qinglanensis]
MHTGAVGETAAELVVAAAAVVERGRLLVVSKHAAPDLFYLPGGKPEPGESLRAALERELREELGVAPSSATPLTEVRATAALEGVPMRLVVFRADLVGRPVPAAEIAALRWTGAAVSPELNLAPAVRNHVLPLVL